MNIVARSEDPHLKEQLKPQGIGGNTAQGMYIVGADGTFYGYLTEHPSQYNPDLAPVRQFLERGLQAFRKNPPAQIHITRATLAGHSLLSPDPTTSIVNIFTRISPVPAGSDELNYSLGRDHYWILAREVQEIASTAHDDGRSFRLPSAMVTRMMRYHLIDNVRGEPDMWQRSEIKQAEFFARYVGPNELAKCYQFRGQFSLETKDGRRGFSGFIEGRFEIQHVQMKLARFRAFARGEAWGSGRFTENAPAGRFPLSIAMVEAIDQISKVVPPEAMGDWADYYLNPDKCD